MLVSEDAPEWREALTTHMAGHITNEICTFVPRPRGVTLVKSKLVPVLKFNGNGTILERATQWVAFRYSQIKDRDLN